MSDDYTLIQRYLQGETNAFSLLYIKYKSIVFYVPRSMGVDEDMADIITSEVFEKALINLAKYKPRFSFQAWLRKIAKNATIDHIRKSRIDFMGDSRCNILDENMEYVENKVFGIDEETPHSILERQEKVDAVREAIDKLPPKFRILILLREYDELTYKEICERTGLKLGTMKSRLHFGRKKLKELL